MHDTERILAITWFFLFHRFLVLSRKALCNNFSIGVLEMVHYQMLMEFFKREELFNVVFS